MILHVNSLFIKDRYSANTVVLDFLQHFQKIWVRPQIMSCNLVPDFQNLVLKSLEINTDVTYCKHVQTAGWCLYYTKIASHGKLTNSISNICNVKGLIKRRTKSSPTLCLINLLLTFYLILARVNLQEVRSIRRICGQMSLKLMKIHLHILKFRDQISPYQINV